MALIDVSQAEAGMKLDADILDKRGRMLIPAGAVLKEKHIMALPQWGVDRIEVEGDDLGSAAEVEPWALEAAEREIEELFSLTNAMHPGIATLKEVCTQRSAVRIQASGLGSAE